MRRGKQIRLFLADGVPGGLTTLEIMNWTGRLISAPRREFSTLLQRDDVDGVGVYLLLGEDQSAVDGLRCYIGETDEIRNRLRQHNDANRGKQFWTRVVIVTSKDANITKGHTRYLEARLIDIASRAERCTLDNSTAPAPPALPEADRSDMEDFIDQLQIVLPVLGCNILRGADMATSMDAVADTASPTFHLTIAKRGIRASAQQVDGEFRLLKGSIIAAAVAKSDEYSNTTRSAYASYDAMHQRLVADGSIRLNGETGELTRDVVFASPSTAGAIVSGRSCNGRQQWQTSAGQSFGAWEDSGS